MTVREQLGPAPTAAAPARAAAPASWRPWELGTGDEVKARGALRAQRGGHRLHRAGRRPPALPGRPGKAQRRNACPLETAAKPSRHSAILPTALRVGAGDRLFPSLSSCTTVSARCGTAARTCLPYGLVCQRFLNHKYSLVDPI